MKFENLPVNNISARGWTKEYLDRQISGITGNIKKCGEPFDTEKCLWETAEQKDNWYPYEQQAYWVDGALKCAYETKNSKLLKEIQGIIYSAIQKAKENGGHIGFSNTKAPKESDTEKSLKYLHWPQAVFFRALMAEYEINKDKRILDALVTHYKSTPLVHVGRNACNVECLAWLYKKTGDTAFKDMAVLLFEKYQTTTEPELPFESLTDNTPFSIHGVTLCETLKLYPIMWDITGNIEYLNMGILGLNKLNKQALMVDGVISSEEFVESNTAIMAHETCDIADYSWALGYFFLATGNTEYLDLIERMCLNAAPAVVTPDFTALQYFSSPNQVIAAENSTHCRYTRGTYTMSYRPYGWAACCVGNVNRIMPNYINKLWHKSDDNSLYATLYAPSYYEEDNLKITEDTEYPFDLKITFTIEAQKPVKRKIGFRIPSWADDYILETTATITKENGFVCAEKEWTDKEIITLTFITQPKLKDSVEGGVYVDYGPLLFALDIERKDEAFVAKTHNSTFYSHNMYPTGSWNYGLRKDLIKKNGIKVEKTRSDDYVWSSPRLKLTVPAQKIVNWTLIKTDTVDRYVYSPDNSVINSSFIYRKVQGEFLMTPPIPDSKTALENSYGEVENITLVPYGIAKLRISVFPSIEKTE